MEKSKSLFITIIILLIISIALSIFTIVKIMNVEKNVNDIVSLKNLVISNDTETDEEIINRANSAIENYRSEEAERNKVLEDAENLLRSYNFTN